MNRFKWPAIMVILFFLFGEAHAATVAADYPAELKQRIRDMKADSRLKKEMPETLPDITTVDSDEVARLLRTKKAVPLDTRIKTQYEAEKIQNAEWLDADDLYYNPALGDKLEKNRAFIVYCTGPACWRSPAAVLMLQHLGLKKLYWYRGGIRDWKDKGYPTE